MTAQDLPALTIAELQPLLRRGEISAREILESLRARINQIDGKIGAYLSLDFEAALREAEKVDV
ncbi:MAG: Asp-tRNA(Asn)/Glu-tRNA(Gln) amidotransferase subunit GatA, partial [Chthoniobacterales bacterium]